MCLNPVEILNPRLISAHKSLVSAGLNPDDFLQDINEAPKISVPCGKCVECLNERATIWNYRVLDETKCHAQNIGITLTYANAPHDLERRDFQLFMKRLRKWLYPQKIRFFGCGEYGSKGKRAHFHCIIFGWCPDDLKFWCYSKSNEPLFRSKKFENANIWPNGYVYFEHVKGNAGKYMSNYFQKLNDFDDKQVKPFLMMSNRPGIGFGAINPDSIKSDKLYDKGKYIKLPRYYLKVLERDGYDLDDLKDNRIKKAQLFNLNNSYDERMKKIKILKTRLCRRPVVYNEILTNEIKTLRNLPKIVDMSIVPEKVDLGPKDYVETRLKMLGEI